MRQLAACFSEDLKMTNGCLPASLLLRDVLASLGVQCRLRSGYFVVTLPDEGSPPPLYAAAHMWVEVQPGDGSGSGATTLDIGLALAEAAGVTTASYQLSTELPPGAQRVDDFQGAGGRLPGHRRAAFHAWQPWQAGRACRGCCPLWHAGQPRYNSLPSIHPSLDPPLHPSLDPPLKDMMEAVMAAMADGADAGPYWAGAPPALQQFRAAMLQRFGA